MLSRIIDVSEYPYRIRMKGRRMALGLDGRTVAEIPIVDLSVVVLSNPGLTLTLATFAELCKENIPVVVCDKNYAPVGLMTPVYGHTTTAKRSRLQVEATAPTLKQAWKQIVCSKIDHQSQVLFATNHSDVGEELRALVKEVKSGDSDNRESVAAKKYWNALFGGCGFRRDYDGNDPINAALNYGYAILRAVVARSVVAAGLTPCFGVHHHNQYDQYALASDLMEPFRPTVDYGVCMMCQAGALNGRLTSANKAKLTRHMTGRYRVDGRMENFFESVTKAVESYVRVLEGKERALLLPNLIPLGPVSNAEPTYGYTPETDSDEEPEEDQPESEAEERKEPKRRPVSESFKEKRDEKRDVGFRERKEILMKSEPKRSPWRNCGLMDDDGMIASSREDLEARPF